MTITASDLLLASLLVFLVLVVPWLSRRDMASLRRTPPRDIARARRRFYDETMVLEWASTAVLLVWWLLLGRSFADIGLAFAPSGWQWLAVAASLVAMALLVVYFRHAGRDPETLAKTREGLGSLVLIVPHTRDEMRRFAWLSVTAGICEEILYRGLLMTMLAEKVGLWPAVVISSVVFGIGHSYQGAAGVVKTGLAGLVMALVVVMTGSLPAAMLVHAVLDVVQGRLLGAAVSASPAVRESPAA